MMWDIALMKFCLITKQTSLSWSAGLNKPHIFMLSALTKARIWTQKTPNPLEISLASAASKGSFPFSPSVPLLWACIWLFSLPQTQSSRFPVTFLHFVRPQGNHVDHGALPCASPLSRSCCAFTSLIPQRHLFILCVCVCFLQGRILVPHQFPWNSTKEIFLSAQQDALPRNSNGAIILRVRRSF